jgi:hypothetical protein
MPFAASGGRIPLAQAFPSIRSASAIRAAPLPGDFAYPAKARCALAARRQASLALERAVRMILSPHRLYL